jgi:hypothetical protein
MPVPPRKRVQWLPLVSAPTVCVWAGETNAQVVTIRQSFTGKMALGWSFGSQGTYAPKLTNTSIGFVVTTRVGQLPSHAPDRGTFQIPPFPRF